VKPSVDREATRQMLADIADAVRPVELARTAAAVDRVLATATPSMASQCDEGVELADDLCVELGLELEYPGLCLDDDCPCLFGAANVDRDEATPGMVAIRSVGDPADRLIQEARYHPWNVSPHLFPEVRS
jgi:hypothetical protein